jgi:putative membrane protein
VQEGVLHRWLKRASVRVETAGQFKHEAGQLGSQWVAPIVKESALLTLVQEVQPDAVIDPPDWTPVDRRAFSRIVRLHSIWILLATLVAGANVGPLVVAPALAAAGLAAWHARRLSRRLAIALTPSSVVVRTGAFSHRRSITRFSRIQSVSCTRSPFDRRWGMARISVDTAGRSAEHRIEMPYLDEGSARDIYQRLRAEVANATRA